MLINLIAVVVAAVVCTMVLWVSFVHGLHHSLTLSIVVTGGITGVLFAAHPALLRLPTWAMLVVWAMLAIGLYVAPPREQPNVLDEFFGGNT